MPSDKPHETSIGSIPLAMIVAYSLAHLDPAMPMDIPTGPAHSVNSFTIRQAVKGLATVLLPYGLVTAYRKIPAELRGQMFGGPSTSHLAIADMRGGMNGWKAIRAHARVRL